MVKEPEAVTESVENIEDIFANFDQALLKTDATLFVKK